MVSTQRDARLLRQGGEQRHGNIRLHVVRANVGHRRGALLQELDCCCGIAGQPDRNGYGGSLV